MSKDKKGVCRRVKVKSKYKRSKGNKNKAMNVWSDIGMWAKRKEKKSRG